MWKNLSPLNENYTYAPVMSIWCEVAYRPLMLSLPVFFLRSDFGILILRRSPSTHILHLPHVTAADYPDYHC